MTILTANPTTRQQPSVRRASTTPPIWRELFAVMEWASLRISPVYYGHGVPRGDGEPVVVVPGFLCSDAVMVEMHSWLGRIGYEPYMSGIGLNVTCPSVTSARLMETVRRAAEETGRRVRIVGHSLGGMLGRRVAMQRPEMVSQVVYLGTPIQAVHAHPAIVAAAEVLSEARSLVNGKRCLAGCGCNVMSDAGKDLPEGVDHAAIFTRSDGVIDWHDAREADPERNFEVSGTHLGLVCNQQAYRVLGRLLASAK
jgi:pimeloyl-ACP methyl ester carboxylesterase